MFETILLAANDNQNSGLEFMNAPSNVFGGFVAYLLFAASVWGMFVKSGRAGWTSLIPIYNWYVVVKIAGFPGATTILYCLPLVNIVFGWFVGWNIGKQYGKSTVFRIFGLILFQLIGFFILSYGSDRYQGKQASQD
ncbi:DUF5684 domain-containing protein [Plantibacter sp. RU18]|uniref:DUF5684 domain-containing protein n=1 Tax=Plantibacter sp. RU18 TaxID=3158143 RepID=UPI003D36B065